MDKFGFPLVTAVDGEPRASSEVIARGVNVQHKNVMALVKRYHVRLEQFGPLAFQTRVKRADGRGGQLTEYVMLNERKREIPPLRSERDRLQAALQPHLFTVQ